MITHAVLAYFRLSDGGFGTEDERNALAQLSDSLAEAIEQAGVGEFDGDEYGEGEGVFYMYGPDADKLFDVVRPLLKSVSIANDGFAIKRYGEPDDPGAKEVRVGW